MSTNGPEIRVSPSYTFKPGLKAKAEIGIASLEQLTQPGDKLNLTSDMSLRLGNVIVDHPDVGRSESHGGIYHLGSNVSRSTLRAICKSRSMECGRRGNR